MESYISSEKQLIFNQYFMFNNNLWRAADRQQGEYAERAELLLKKSFLARMNGGCRTKEIHNNNGQLAADHHVLHLATLRS